MEADHNHVAVGQNRAVRVNWAPPTGPAGPPSPAPGTSVGFLDKQSDSSLG